MKILIDIPDGIIPPDILKAINEDECSEIQNRQIVLAFLKIAIAEIDECKINSVPLRSGSSGARKDRIRDGQHLHDLTEQGGEDFYE
jgi:hypothetical protein